MAPRSPAFLWARVALLGGLVLGTFGAVINDEQDQAAAMHNLGHGSLVVVEHPDQFYLIKGDLHRAVRFEGPEPIGSTLLDYLALPMFAVVQVADELMPLGVWAALGVLALVWSLASGTRRPLSPARAAAVTVMALVFLTSGFTFRRLDVDLTAAVAALQWTNLLLSGAAAALLALAAQRHVQGPPVHVALATVVAGPMMFWASRLKYSMLAATLVCAALWLAGEPASFRRNLALGLVAALAIWNNIGEGAVLLGAGGLWLAVEVWRNRTHSGPTWPSTAMALATTLLGLAAGLVPWALENQVLRGHPFRASYLTPFTSDANPSAEGVSSGSELLDLVFGHHWQGPVDFALNILGPWTTGWRTESEPLGVFVIAPLLALALWTVVRPIGWRRPDLFLAALIVLSHVILLTNRVVRQGWGLDARLLVPILPAVGLLATPMIGYVLERDGPDAARRAGRLAILWGAAGTALLLTAGFAFDRGLRNWQVDRLLFISWGLVGAAVVALYAVGRRFGILNLAVRPSTVAVGLALALPVLWTVLAALGAPSSAPAEDDLRVTAFLPVVDDLRAWLSPRLLPPGPLPIVTDEFGRIVFHPDFGYCAVDPSPCPWWSNSTAPPPPATGSLSTS